MAFLDEVEAAIPALRRYARALLRDGDRADDLVQDCLERALVRQHSWRGEGSLRAWMFRILLNLCRDGARQAARRGHLVPVDDLWPEPAQPAPQEDHLALAEVERAITRLPDDQRAALLMVTIAGMTLAEAAAALDIGEGTLTSRLGRARESLRAMVGRPANGPKTAGLHLQTETERKLQ